MIVILFNCTFKKSKNNLELETSPKFKIETSAEDTPLLQEKTPPLNDKLYQRDSEVNQQTNMELK